MVEPGYADDMQALARKVVQLQTMLRDLRQLQVGYRVNPHARDSITPPTVPAYFDPEQQPQLGPRGDEQPTLASWKDTRDQHDRVTAAVRGFATLYPTIYVLLQQDRLQELAAAGTAEKMQSVVEAALAHAVAKIAESRSLLGADIAYYDLVALHGQLFNGNAAVPFAPPVTGRILSTQALRRTISQTRRLGSSGSSSASGWLPPRP